ncbi:unnamed protein product [Cuscuta campestris]|uniref:Serine-threonine/tyrosine-protein kinase catalytic domain-containing protein n=1 Tax=Cuscuta campestris TaxID=132261 RepID=A0A484N7K9_9ASTE|nr:unnamed protein product [Cuscuta campestris]
MANITSFTAFVEILNTVARPCLDIYVYGVILLQFLCGQKNISSIFVVTMRGRIEDGDDVICEKLKMSGCNGQIAADMIKLALDCTQKNTIRPSALTIVKRFGAIAVHHKVWPPCKVDTVYAFAF